MFFHKPPVLALALIVLSMATTTSIGASQAKHTMYVTFNRSVSLPGVTLRSGTYIFEAPNPDSDHDLVRVLSRDRSKVFLTTFTRTVQRRAGLKHDPVITFGELSPEGTLPVLAWWPEGTEGHQFIYPNR
ncbi:MAG TPA: hypothetical protein VF456_26085 [Vicinamibacterales bacterium]